MWPETVQNFTYLTNYLEDRGRATFFKNDFKKKAEKTTIFLPFLRKLKKKYFLSECEKNDLKSLSVAIQ